MEISKADITSAASLAGQKPQAMSSAAQELRGAEVLVKALQSEGVKYVWGYPGGAVLHIYDAFYKQDSILHVLVRHEQAAVHAADGYARATGEVVVNQFGSHERSECGISVHSVRVGWLGVASASTTNLPDPRSADNVLKHDS